MQYKNWLYQWLNNYIKPVNKTRTYTRYKQLIDNHITKHIGNYLIDDLTPVIIQEFIANLLQNGNSRNGQPLSPNTVNSIISILQNSLKIANMLGYSQNYIGDKILRPKPVEKQVQCFSIQEQNKLEMYCLGAKKKKLYGIIITLYTGLRIGELLALKFSDIDFTKSIMNITKTCFDTPTGRVTEPPKTPSSIRTIPLPKQILNLIKTLKKHAQCDYIIADGTKPISVRSYQRSFELILKKLNIPHKGFHSLRHTFATRALEIGMDVKTLSELLGHKNTNITLNRYVHSMLEHKTNMMNRLAKSLTKMSTD